MQAQLLGYYVGHREGTFEDKEKNVLIDYHHIHVLSPDESDESGEPYKFSIPLTYDISHLKKNTLYVFNVIIPRILRANAKLKCISVSEFKE